MSRLFDAERIYHCLTRGMIDFRLLVAIPVLSAGTFVLASSGIDAAINDLARLQDSTLSIAWSAFPMLVGMVAPFAIPIIFALKGLRNLANGSLSAFLVTLIIVSFLKVFTSRVHPEALEPATVLERSQLFRFGFFESGITSVIEGWPSGHVATNGAVALVIVFLAGNKSLRYVAAFWCLWVTLATVFGISGDVHWFSDTLSGLALAVIVALRTVESLRDDSESDQSVGSAD